MLLVELPVLKTVFINHVQWLIDENWNIPAVYIYNLNLDVCKWLYDEECFAPYWENKTMCFFIYFKQKRVNFCLTLPALRSFNHQANKLNKNSSIQNVNSLYEMFGLTAEYWVSVAAVMVIIKNLTNKYK